MSNLRELIVSLQLVIVFVQALYRRGNVWWLKYYRNGKSYRESSGTTKKMVAQKLLERRTGEIVLGKLPGVIFEKVYFDDLSAELLKDYQINQRKSRDRVKKSVEHLEGYFAGMKVTQITTSAINNYMGAFAFSDNKLKNEKMLLVT